MRTIVILFPCQPHSRAEAPDSLNPACLDALFNTALLTYFLARFIIIQCALFITAILTGSNFQLPCSHGFKTNDKRMQAYRLKDLYLPDGAELNI